MIPFHSVEASQAVSEFVPCRRQKFKVLTAAKEIIAALRQKGASHTTIAELLAPHCLSTGKTNVAEFCHAVLTVMLPTAMRIFIKEIGTMRLLTTQKPLRAIPRIPTPLSVAALLSYGNTN